MSVREEIIGNARLLLGDCREILPTLTGVDAVVTDPPYGIGITKSHRISTSRGFGGVDWDESTPDAATIAAIVSMAPSAIVWGGNYFDLPPTRCVLVWDKINEGRDFADLEMAWTNIDAVARIFRRRPMNMDGGKVHPTQKPIELMRWCLEKVPAAKTIMDPFMGSGSTGVACAQLGRKFVGIEVNPTYYEIALRRIEEASKQGDLIRDVLPQTKPEQRGLEL